MWTDPADEYNVTRSWLKFGVTRSSFDPKRTRNEKVMAFWKLNKVARGQKAIFENYKNIRGQIAGLRKSEFKMLGVNLKISKR